MHATLIPIPIAEALLAEAVFSACDAFLTAARVRAETAHPDWRAIIETLRWDEL